MKALLVLENGESFEGISIGIPGTTIGEVVFNTAITGYQEIMTDPSYKGQIVTMTYTQIGNYGFNNEDEQSYKPFVEGFIVKESSEIISNFRGKETLNEYLKRHSIVGISNIDTRKLTKLLRVKGSLIGGITTEYDVSSMREKINKFEIVGKDLVKHVTTKKTYNYRKGLIKLNFEKRKINKILNSERVVVLDFGVKINILGYLKEVGFDVYVINAYTEFSKVKELKPKAILLSNGPGDPRGIDKAWISEYRKIIESFPTFGICFGHQIIARAFDINIYKMKFGHHGGNHPVKDLSSNSVFVTAQNHNYAIDNKKALEKGFKITYINLNDGSVEGIEHTELPVMAVQYHPEASPGPRDAEYLFENFALMVKKTCK